MSQPDAAEPFSRRLRETRKQIGLEQAQLSAISGIPATSLSHFEAGRRKPSLVNLRNLADALGVSVDFLLGRTDNPVAHVDAAAFRDEHLYSARDRELLEDFKALLAKRAKE
ncbi:MAG: helix-turn-helix transcriptional regulator [Gammaproteobacteria bacterium]|nr:helix-turn-helix transcriptional regulator [Gammaproteobacteria bacterium]